MRSILNKIACTLSCLLLSIEAMELCSGPVELPLASEISKASNTSTGNPQFCPTGTKYFSQLIHHNITYGEGDNSTFLQQYQIVDTYYRPGGPILFLQGDESTISCIEFTAISAWAEELGALAVTLEHRYFGLSCPYGLNYTEAGDWDPKNLEALTLNNVLMDTVNFLNFVKNVAHPAVKNAEVIVMAGSYGGFLTASLRIHCSEHIFAAIASSPPTKGLVSDPMDPLALSRGAWANMVYNDYSPVAAAKIKSSFTDLRTRMASGNFSGLQEQLHLCYPPNSTAQTDALLESLQTAYSQSTQFNLWVLEYPFYRVVNETLALNDSMAILGAAVETIIPIVQVLPGVADTPCLSWLPSYKAVHPYLWLRCHYLPTPNYYSGEDTIFGANLPDYTQKHILDPWCKASFGVESVTGGSEYQWQIGLDPQTLQSTSRLLISMGLLDPISSNGPDSWNPSPNRNDSRVMFIGQAAHTADITVANSTDPEALTQARTYELNTMKEWLGLAY